MRRATSRILLAALCAAAILPGCATITGAGRDQKVKVASNPAGAEVVVDGRPCGVTPTVVQLSRKTEHDVEISHPGYEPAHVLVQRCINPWVFGNLLVGGLVGVTVDVCTDATHNLSPDDINVNLRCLDGPPGPLAAGPRPAAAEGRTGD
jgi:hypothetical protein